jgi:hypothetical protein
MRNCRVVRIKYKFYVIPVAFLVLKDLFQGLLISECQRTFETAQQKR